MTALAALAAPAFLLGLFRSIRIGLALVASSAGAGMFYLTKRGIGPAFEEWGATFAPSFFLMLAVALLVELLIGLLVRIAFQRLRAKQAQSIGEVM